MRPLSISLAVLATVIAPALSSAQALHQDFIVDTEWLAEHLGDESLVIIQTGRETDYDSGHIPGAQFLALADVSIPRGEGLMLEFPSLSELQKAFERVGVRDDSRIVVYFGANFATAASRIFFTLDYLGLGDRVSLLDGGLDTWTAEGRPTSTARPETGTGSFTPHPNPDLVARAGWLLEEMERSDIDVLDARAAVFYNGERESMSGRGHIPTAKNIQFSSLLGEDLKFKDATELRELFVNADVGDGDTVVTYCHIGQQASLLYFVARYLGYEAKLYDGSFEEWSRDGHPVVNRSEQ